jgi:hypothetical protein
MPKLNSTNPEHLIYHNEKLRIAVLGGIRLEGLDRLRTTLKVEADGLALRHNLDLYNDNQVDKLVRKVAEKLEVSTVVITKSLLELTSLLEQYRLQELEQQQNPSLKKKVLSDKEIKEAKTYLSKAKLMERTKVDIGRSGVVGEEYNRLLMYLIFTSRKREHPLHIISLGSSGIGKTHLQEKVGELIPEEDKIEVTSLSSNAFYYFGQRQLKNKLILIEDLDGADSVLYPLRELQSKRRITKTIVHKNTKGETRSINLTVEGPISVSGCTTKESLYEDNANRSFLIHINESKDQDELIMEYQRKVSAGKINMAEEHKIKEMFKNHQRVLQPIRVRNPYAELLQLPSSVFKPRRTNAHYLAFIEAVTFYHQYQRKVQVDAKTKEEFIETTIEDIAEANKLLKPILIRKSDTLNGATRSYFERLKDHFTVDDVFGNKEVREAFRIKATTLRRYHNHLLDAGLIKIKSGSKNTGYKYQITTQEDYVNLENNINNTLDLILERCASAPLVSHYENGSPKPKRNSKLTSGEPQNSKGMTP